MPNWCQNVAYIRNEDLGELDKIVKELDKKNDCQLFNSLVPNPSGEWQYDWSVENWGTKWDAQVYDYRLDDGELYISFDTAWAPPIAFYDKIFEMGYEVKAYYREEGMCFAGIYEDGADDCYEYANLSADEIEEQLPSELDEMFSISEYQRDYEAEQEDEEEWDAEAELEKIEVPEEEPKGKFKFASEDEKDWLRKLLKDEIVTLTFIKKDGTERVMKCTLNENVIPFAVLDAVGNKNHKKSTEAQSVYDLESEGWRSFRWDSLRKIEFSLGEAVKSE